MMRQAPFEYVRNYKAVCAGRGPAAVGASNVYAMQVQDAVRQAIYARQFCTDSAQECDALLRERIRNSDPPPRA